MLKKKDPSKPFWKRLVKSAEKVKLFEIDLLFNFHHLVSMDYCRLGSFHS